MAIEKFKAVEATEKQKAIVITDNDGAGQFDALVSDGVIHRNRFFCIDTSSALMNHSELERWLLVGFDKDITT